MLTAKEVEGVVVTKLDRLSRDVADFATVLKQFRKKGWSVATLDLDIDTAPTNGEMIAHVLMALAQWERRQIGDRTRAALAELKRQGKHIGRPSKTDLRGEVVNYITMRRSEGAGIAQIARELNEAGHQTSLGNRFYPSTVAKLIERVARVSGSSCPAPDASRHYSEPVSGPGFPPRLETDQRDFYLVARAKLPDDLAFIEFEALIAALGDVVSFGYYTASGQTEWSDDLALPDAEVVRVRYGSEFLCVIGIGTAVMVALAPLGKLIESTANAFAKVQEGLLTREQRLKLKEERLRERNLTTDERAQTYAVLTGYAHGEIGRGIDNLRGGGLRRLIEAVGTLATYRIAAKIERTPGAEPGESGDRSGGNAVPDDDEGEAAPES